MGINPGCLTLFMSKKALNHFMGCTVVYHVCSITVMQLMGVNVFLIPARFEMRLTMYLQSYALWVYALWQINKVRHRHVHLNTFLTKSHSVYYVFLHFIVVKLIKLRNYPILLTLFQLWKTFVCVWRSVPFTFIWFFIKNLPLILTYFYLIAIGSLH